MGSTGREKEIKAGLASSRGLEAVLAALEPTETPRTVLQDNHFFDAFDTNEFVLNGAKVTCRLRVSEDAYVLTLKGREKDLGGGTTEKPEEEWDLPAEAAREMLVGERDVLAFLDAQQLSERQRALVDDFRAVLAGRRLAYAGHFPNVRTVVPTELEVDGKRVAVHMELDRSLFPDGSPSHEIELEIPPGQSEDSYKAAIVALLKSAGVESVKHPPKAKRLFAALKAQRDTR